MGEETFSNKDTDFGKTLWNVQTILPQNLSSDYLHERLQMAFLRLQRPESAQEALEDFLHRYVLRNDETIENELAYVFDLKWAGVGLKYGIARLVLLMCWISQKEMTYAAQQMYHIILS